MPSPSRPASATSSKSLAPSGTPTTSVTRSVSGTVTGSSSVTPSNSVTPSGTTSPTCSSSTTPSGTPTATSTATPTRSPSTTPSSTATPSGTAMATQSSSTTPSTTVTPSGSASATQSVSTTPSSTVTPSASTSASTSGTRSASCTATPSASGTPTSTPSVSITATASPVSPTPSMSGTGAPTPSSSAPPGALVLAATLELPVLAGVTPQPPAPSWRTALVALGLPPPLLTLSVTGGGSSSSSLAPPACALLPPHVVASAAAAAGLPACDTTATQPLLTPASLVAASGSNGRWQLQLATAAASVTVAGGARNASSCLAQLHCTVSDGSSSANASLPLVHLATALPLLVDVVVEGPPLPSASSDGGAVTLALRSQLQGQWAPPVPLACGNSSACSGAAGEAAAAAAALALSSSLAPGAPPAALSLLLSGRANATLVAGTDGLFATTAAQLWALARSKRVDGTAVTSVLRLPLRPVPAVSAVADVATAAALKAGRLARVTLPNQEEVCGAASAPDAPCSLSLLALPPAAGPGLPALAALAGVDLTFPSGAGFAAARALVAAGPLPAALQYPPFPLQSGSGETLVLGASATASGVTALSSSALNFAPVASVLTTSATGRRQRRQLALPASSSLPLLLSPSSASPSSATSALGLTGIWFTASCAESGLYLDATKTSVCSNASSPERSRCAWGSGSGCTPCPAAGALCPGGRALVPLPGWWVPAPLGSPPSQLVSCPPPALSRCPGGVNAATGASACAEGYLEGSYACSVCAVGWYPDTAVSGPSSGRCLRCPDVSSWDVVVPSLTVSGYVAATIVPLAAVIVFFHRRNGGTLGAGAARGLLFLHSVFGALQVLVQTQPPPVSSLPPATSTIFDGLQVLQFRAPHPHPACTPGSTPLSSETAGLAVPLAFVCTVPLLVAATRRWGTAVAPSSKAARALRRALPLATRLMITICLLLYGRTIAIAYSVLRCEPAVMAAGAYSTLASADGTALAAALPDAPPQTLDALRRCTAASAAATSGLDCESVLAIKDVQLPIQVLASDPYIVCGEGPQPGAATLAAAVLALLGFALPLGYYAYYKLRVAAARKGPAHKLLVSAAPKRWSGKRLSASEMAAALAASNPLASSPAAAGDVAFFVRGTTKPQRPAFLLVDITVLHCIIVAKAYFTPSANETQARLFLGLALSPLLAGMVYTGLAKPHNSALHHWLSLFIDGLTCMALALCYAAYSQVLDPAAAASGGTDGATVTALGYVVLICAVMVFLAVFTAFAVTIARGARMEQLRLKAAADAASAGALVMTQNRLNGAAGSGEEQAPVAYPLLLGETAGLPLSSVAVLAPGEKADSGGTMNALWARPKKKQRSRREFEPVLASDAEKRNSGPKQRVELRPLSTAGTVGLPGGTHRAAAAELADLAAPRRRSGFGGGRPQMPVLRLQHAPTAVGADLY